MPLPFGNHPLPDLRTIRFHPDDAQTGGAIPETPAPVTPTTDAGSVSLTKAEYAELIRKASTTDSATAKAAELEGHWNHAQRLLAEGVDPAAAEESIRHVLAATGRTPAQIDAYLAQRSAADDDEPAPTRRARGGRGNSDEEGDETVESLKAQIGNLNAGFAEQRATYLKNTLDAQVAGALDGSKEIGILIKDLTGFSPEEGEEGHQAPGSVRETLAEEIRNEAKANLRERRALETRRAGRETWDDRWIAEETKKAVTAIHKKFRQFVPDPSKIGRSPDMNPWEDALRTNKPVPAPVYEKGMNVSTVSEKIREFAADSLLRGAAEASRDGSRV